MILSLLRCFSICLPMIVNPALCAPQGGYGVDNHRQADILPIKQTKDYSDNLKVSYFNSRASRSTAEVGLPFMHNAHQLERVTCIREIYKSPVIRLQSGLRDFFFQNAVKNRNITLDSVHPTRSSSSAQCQGAWKYAHSYLPFQLSEHLH